MPKYTGIVGIRFNLCHQRTTHIVTYENIYTDRLVLNRIYHQFTYHTASNTIVETAFYETLKSQR